MSKKLSTVIFFITILILTIVSGYFSSSYLYGKKIEPFSPEKTLGIRPPIFVFYNGTRFFITDVTPIFLENKEPLFYLTMQLMIPDYNGSISVTIPDSEAKYIYNSLYRGEKNGSYDINNLPVYLKTKKGDYPYDYYVGNISFWDKNSNYTNLFAYGVNKTYSSPEWKMVIFGDYNSLHFAIYRVRDVSIYETLGVIGIIVLLINIWFLILLIISFYYKSINFLDASIVPHIIIISNALFYVGISLGIPFYFGTILNTYLLADSNQSSIFIYLLYALALSSIVIGSIGYAIKEKIKASNKAS